MNDTKSLRLTIALSALFIGLALIFATAFPVVAQQLGWLPTTGLAIMQGGMMNGGYMNGGMMNGLMPGFGMPWMGFGFFFWPLLLIGLLVLGLIWFARSKPATS